MTHTRLTVVAAVWLAGSTIGATQAADLPGALTAADLAARIDTHIQRQWAQSSVAPTVNSDDVEFLRRVHLDLGGRPPTPATVKDFLANDTLGKRGKVIQDLLQGPGYALQFSLFWRDVLMPDALTEDERLALVPPFELWLRQHLANNTPFDEMVRELLTTSLDFSFPARRGTEPRLSAAPYFLGKPVSPETLAAATSRALLGIRIECAQCHDHPFDTWKREEFWGYAAFFGGLQRTGTSVLTPVREVYDRRELTIPDTLTVVQATYLDRTEPRWRPREGARVALARWLTSTDNPYFARATVNRIWGYFLGYGLVDPIDDFARNNPPSHPELLDELAREFIQHGYDLRFLIRSITGSQTYQLSSRRTGSSPDDPRLFARMTLRALSPHQLRMCLSQVLGESLPETELERLLSADFGPPRDRQISTLFALAAMNGPDIARATAANSKFVNSSQSTAGLSGQIESIYLSVLCRPPRVEEHDRWTRYMAGGGDARSLSDLLWVLLNSTEFIVNH